jgi:hypothetical protein
VLDTNKTVTARYADTAAPEDCFSYDPTRLSIVDLSSAGNGFELRAGTVFLQSLATMRDAQDAQSVARGFTTRCFVGRGDGGGVMPYWKGGAGRPGPVSAPTCFSYNRSTLRVTEESPTKWHLGDGTIVFGGYFVSEAKAVRALRVAQQHNQQCFIGLNNTQNNPQYAMGYWP